MFIVLPLILIGLSLLGIVMVVYKKLPYLRKLSPEAHQVSAHVWEDYFPELIQWVAHIPWREYRQAVLRELEKFLRKVRLALLKVDHISDSLIKKVRRSHLTTQLENVAAIPESQKIEVRPATPKEPTQDELKAQEQQLIIDISQDPKNASLYETLGDLYMKMGSIEDAKESYEAALGITPDNQTLARKYSALLKKKESVA